MVRLTSLRQVLTTAAIQVRSRKSLEQPRPPVPAMGGLLKSREGFLLSHVATTESRPLLPSRRQRTSTRQNNRSYASRSTYAVVDMRSTVPWLPTTHTSAYRIAKGNNRRCLIWESKNDLARAHSPMEECLTTNISCAIRRLCLRRSSSRMPCLVITTGQEPRSRS